MALETFKAQLKAKAKTLGVTNLSNKRIDAYAAILEKQNPNLATDDDHAEKVEAFLEIVDIKQIAAYDDWQASKGKNGGKPNEKKTPEKKEGGEDQPTPDPATPGDDTPPWAKTLIEQNKVLSETVAKLQAKENRMSMQQRLKESLKDIPESFYRKWALPEKEEDLEAFENDVKAEWEAFTKENPISTSTTPAAGGTGGHKPNRGTGGNNEKASKEEVEAIVNNIM